ncbi:MAG TPA: hypothetical protein VFW87_13965, partial [Pirellulales bacterium]|nr:hypothetical protein [Pirellulales bacterium]
MMPQTTYSCLFVLATLLCSFGCSAKAPTPINKPTDGAASNKNNESPTGGNMPVVPSNEMKPAQPEPIAWKPFSPPSGRYSVLLPDAAQALPSNRPTITNHGVSL